MMAPCMSYLMRVSAGLASTLGPARGSAVVGFAGAGAGVVCGEGDAAGAGSAGLVSAGLAASGWANPRVARPARAARRVMETMGLWVMRVDIGKPPNSPQPS